VVSCSRASLPPQGAFQSPGSLNAAVSTPATLTSPKNRCDLDGLREPIRGRYEPRKRRRTDSSGYPDTELALQAGDSESNSSKLPAPHLLEAIIDAYFRFIHPWIPILHPIRFRRRDYGPKQLPLLHAIVVVAIRFADCDSRRVTAREMELWMSRSRRIVLQYAMEGLSVENVQALSILAFSDVCPRRSSTDCIG